MQRVLRRAGPGPLETCGTRSPSIPATLPASAPSQPTKCFGLHSQPVKWEASHICPHFVDEEAKAQRQEADPRSQREFMGELPPP